MIMAVIVLKSRNNWEGPNNSQKGSDLCYDGGNRMGSISVIVSDSFLDMARPSGLGTQMDIWSICLSRHLPARKIFTKFAFFCPTIHGTPPGTWTRVWKEEWPRPIVTACT